MNKFINEKDLDQSIIEAVLNKKELQKHCSEIFLQEIDAVAALFLVDIKEELGEIRILKEAYDFQGIWNRFHDL